MAVRTVETEGSTGTAGRPVDVGLASPGGRRRRPSLVLIGLLCIAGAALGGALLYGSVTSTTLVLAADRDLPAGHVVTPADLRAVELSGLTDVATIAVDDQALILGQEARGPVPAGTVLNTEMFGDQGSAIPAGMAVVGAALDPGAAPGPSLRAGDRVQVLAITNGLSGLDLPADAEATVVTAASVWSVEAPEGGLGGSYVVSLLVPIEAQTVVAQAAADGRLRLALVGGG